MMRIKYIILLFVLQDIQIQAKSSYDYKLHTNPTPQLNEISSRNIDEGIKALSDEDIIKNNVYIAPLFDKSKDSVFKRKDNPKPITTTPKSIKTELDNNFIEKNLILAPLFDKTKENVLIKKNTTKIIKPKPIILDKNFIKENVYLAPLFDKSDVSHKTKRDNRSKVDSRAKETKLRVVNMNLDENFNNTKDVLDVIVFPDTNITSIVKMNEKFEDKYKFEFQNGLLRAKPFLDGNFTSTNVEQNDAKRNKINETSLHDPVKTKENGKYVLIPVTTANGMEFFEEGKPMTFIPVSVEKLRMFIKGIEDPINEDNENYKVKPAKNN